MTETPTIATKDRLGSYDAIETAKPGEPLFPIQGGDPFGPPTVMHWAMLARQAGMTEEDPRKADKLLSKASDAERVAWAMQDYQRGIEELPGRRATYTDHGVPDTDAVRSAREAMIAGSDRLHNAIAVTMEVIDTLAKLRLHPEQEVRLREAVEMIRESAHAIEPRRGMERS